MWHFFIGISIHFWPKEHLMAKSTFFQSELENRVFGLWKWSKRQKTGFFSQFSEFLKFTWFWQFLTRFWLRNAQAGFGIFYEFSNRYLAFLSQKWVGSGQNRQKIKNSENWGKIQFFYALTTLVAQELDSPAQIADRPFFDFFDFFIGQKRPFGGAGNEIHAQLRYNSKFCFPFFLF